MVAALIADGFRNYLRAGHRKPAEELLVERANMLTSSHLLLIRLFQHATKYSVGACRVRLFLETCANFSVSSPAKRPVSSI